jgi:hypothetical protein
MGGGGDTYVELGLGILGDLWLPVIEEVMRAAVGGVGGGGADEGAREVEEAQSCRDDEEDRRVRSVEPSGSSRG